MSGKLPDRPSFPSPPAFGTAVGMTVFFWMPAPMIAARLLWDWSLALPRY